jgi:hypothetical protein
MGARAALAGIAMAASLGIGIQPAKALTRYESLVTCPIDGKQFKALMVGSYYRRGVRLDTQPLGSLIAPYPYPVCPENGFVMYQNEFLETELSAIKLIVLSDEYRRLRSENTDYYMAAYVKERLGATDYDVGNTYLKASWEAERDKPQSVALYRALAFQSFDALTKREPNHSLEWWTASVLAAELDRLLGHFDAVETRFNALPLAELNVHFSDAGLMGALYQIRMHALRHNSQPEQLRLIPPEGETVGFGGVK